MLLLYCILDSVPNRRCDESAVAKQKLDMGRQDTERRARAKVCVCARAQVPSPQCAGAASGRRAVIGWLEHRGVERDVWFWAGIETATAALQLQCSATLREGTMVRPTR